MKFEITVLGSGSAVPTQSRNPTSHLINIQEEYLLADCGEGTQLQLKLSGAKMQRIRHIFITHLHGDHFFGLPGLLSTMHLLGRNRPLDIHGPIGLEKAVMGMVEVSKHQLRYPLRFHEIIPGKANILVDTAKIEVSAFPLLHKIPTTGFLFKEKPKKRVYKPEMGEDYGVPKFWIDRIKDGEDYVDANGETVPNQILTSDPPSIKSYAFCTDTAYYPKVMEHITGVDLLYHEASFMNSERARALETRHCTAEDAAKIAKLVGAKQLLLGHFSARYKQLDQLKIEAEKEFNNVILAEDGMVIQI